MLSREEYLKLPLEERYIKLDASEKERAEELFEKSTTVDLHTHIFGSVFFEYEYEQVRQMGVDGLFEAVPCLSEDFLESMKILGRYKSITMKEPGLIPAYTAADVEKAKKEGKQAVLYQLEPHTFKRNPDLVEVAYGLGIRMALLTFNSRNYQGDGCSERTDSGLSYLGMELIERMNKIGMMVDLSHVGIKTTLDAIEHSKDPVLLNHTGARVLNPPVLRLKPDEPLKAVAEKGGLIGISAIPNQLSSQKKQGIDDLLNHLDYCIKLVGIDHVVIGLDNVFRDQVAGHKKQEAKNMVNFARSGIVLAADYMWGIESPGEWPNIVRGLVKRGYSDSEIKKIIGENALRVMRKIIG
ncbi:MAG: dipeptidase [Candidatus Thorarchaeota archaeon]